MRILVIGSGARESALCWKFSRSSAVSKVYSWPGSSATRAYSQVLDLPKSAEFTSLAEHLLKKEKVDFVVVGPEVPLADGVADVLAAAGVPVFGPTRELAQLESSKSYAKKIMAAAGVPTAAFDIATNESECLSLASARLNKRGAVVLKASGLAAGKGVFVCLSESDLTDALRRLYHSDMKAAAAEVLVEEFLEGRESSFFVFLGRQEPQRLGFAVDYKRRNDKDKGPNTGGMGSYTPVSWLPVDAEQQVMNEIVDPLVSHLKKSGKTYVGCLYVGLMWCGNQPKVVEFNIRLGDPEAQILAVADDTDWAQLIAYQLGLVKNPPVRNGFSPTVGVVMASTGYPYESTPDEEFSCAGELFVPDALPIAFGSAIESLGGKKYNAKSGRVLTVVARSKTMTDARKLAYDKVAEIKEKWQKCHYRQDIGENV
ncbi:MAG: phosphoribosylamine--glycine ligase [Oligoflexales bacterium]